MSQIPLAGSLLEKDTLTTSLSGRNKVLQKFSSTWNSCFLCECCCPGYAIVLGSILLAAVELGIQVIFLTYPLLIWSKFFPGFYKNIQKGGNNTNGRLSPVPEHVVIYESAAVFGHAYYFLGSVENVSTKNQKVTGEDAAAEVQLKLIGLSDEELNTLSKATIFIPFTICVIAIVGATALLIGSLIKHPHVCLLSSLLHFMVVWISFAYMIFISLVINKMVTALDKENQRSFDTKFNYTYQLWIELSYYVVFFPLGLFSTINGLGLYHRFRKITKTKPPKLISSEPSSTSRKTKNKQSTKSKSKSSGKQSKTPIEKSEKIKKNKKENKLASEEKPPPFKTVKASPQAASPQAMLPQAVPPQAAPPQAVLPQVAPPLAVPVPQRWSTSIAVPIVPYQGPMFSFPGKPIGGPEPIPAGASLKTSDTDRPSIHAANKSARESSGSQGQTSTDLSGSIPRKSGSTGNRGSVSTSNPSPTKLSAVGSSPPVQDET